MCTNLSVCVMYLVCLWFGFGFVESLETTYWLILMYIFHLCAVLIECFLGMFKFFSGFLSLEICGRETGNDEDQETGGARQRRATGEGVGTRTRERA